MLHPQFCQTKGFPIAEHEAIRQVTANTATKQDLVISAYKPTAAFEQRFHSQAGSESGAWAFADEHLRRLLFDRSWSTAGSKCWPSARPTCSSTAWWPSTSSAG